MTKYVFVMGGQELKPQANPLLCSLHVPEMTSALLYFVFHFLGGFINPFFSYLFMSLLSSHFIFCFLVLLHSQLLLLLLISQLRLGFCEQDARRLLKPQNLLSGPLSTQRDSLVNSNGRKSRY